jgi:adenine-specific DNA-methyltransferase
VLGAVESGVDLEKRIAAIYQDCRTSDEIRTAFDALQRELDETIQAGMDRARRAVLDNFDAEVHERLRLHKEQAKQSLDVQQQMLLDLAKFELAGRARFAHDEPSFELHAQADQPALRFHLDWQRAEELGDTFFRLDLKLASDLIDQGVNRPAAPAEVIFRYDSHASALERYCGSSGWLEVAKLSAKSIGESEETLLISACDAREEAVDPEVAKKLFSLKGEVGNPVTWEPPAAISDIQGRLRAGYLDELATRNQTYFEEEVEKLDRWAEDLKQALERELKDLDAEIRAARKASKAGITLAEKLDAQKVIKSLELKRMQKRRELFDAQDEVDRKRASLIEETERQLETSSTCESVFRCKWRLDSAQPTRSEEQDG